MRRRGFVRAVSGLGIAAVLAPATTVRAQTALTVGMQAAVSTDGVNLRGGPGTDQPVVGTLPGGAAVDVLGSSADGAWWRVAGDSGVGYGSAAFLEPNGQPTTSGVFDLDLPIPYARQLTSVWCDPA